MVHNRLLYDAQISAKEVKGIVKLRAFMIQPQIQPALRVAKFDRTTADITSLLLAQMPPDYLQALERKRTAELKNSGGKVSKANQRMETVRQWQHIWANEITKAVIIPDVCKWWRKRPKMESFQVAK